MRLILVTLACISLFSCQNRHTRQALTVRADSFDATLLQIAEDARRTLPIFFRHLSRPQAGMGGFAVKYPLEADGGSGIGMEQVWLNEIHLKNGQYHGILASSPLHAGGMKRGGTIAFDTDLITDWMYIHEGRIAGGRSIQYLLEQIPESQRSQEQWEMLNMFD